MRNVRCVISRRKSAGIRRSSAVIFMSMVWDSYARNAIIKLTAIRTNKKEDVIMKFWLGLIIGFLGGGIFGVFIMALCIAGKSRNMDD